MSLTEPPFVPPGLLRLDAVTDDERRVVVRIRSAAALGLPVCPWTLDERGQTEKRVDLGNGSSFPDPFYEPVYAISSDVPVTTLSACDDRGHAATSGPGVFDPDIGLLPQNPVVGGGPLVDASGSDVMLGWIPHLWAGAGNRTWALAADSEILPDGPWRVTGPGATRDDQALADLLGSSGDFVHPYDYLDSLPPGTIPGAPPPTAVDTGDLIARGREILAPGSGVIAALIGGAEPPDPLGARLGGPGDPTGDVAMDLVAWLGAVSADPAAASLLGTYAVLTDADGLLLHTLTASATFVVPAPYTDAPPGLQVAWALAEVTAEQDALGRHLGDQHPGLDDLVAALPDTHRVVHLQVPAIVARMPLPPGAPVLTAVPGGLVVSNHQGGPIALRRFDETGEHRDRYLLLPASGELLEPFGSIPPGPMLYEGEVQDVWGQWSGSGSTPTIERPVPATAAPMVTLELEGSAPGVSPDDDPASPGQVVIRAFAATPPTFGVDITAMSAALTGTGDPLAELVPDPVFDASQPAADGRWWVARAAVLPTRPGETTHVGVLVTAHAGSTEIPAEHRDLRVVDVRPVAVELSSPMMLFSGPAGPDPTDGSAEADLLVPRPALPTGTTFRLYAADEGVLLGPPGAGPRHARVAALLAAARTAERSSFVRLPSDAVRTLSSGELRVRATLPGRSVALRVLRLAAVSAAGLEAPGSRCGAFVVAVPLDDVPGRPSLMIGRAGPRMLRASVVLTYPRPPGETMPSPFGPRGTPAATPVPAEVWWGPDGTEAGPHGAVRAGTINLLAEPAVEGVPWRWHGQVDLELPTSVPAWTPLRLWARVAWPAEPAWIPDTTPVPGLVRRRWGDVDAQPSQWSEWSPAVSATPSEARIDASFDLAGGPNLSQLTLPVLAPGSPPWQIVASNPGWEPVRLTSPGGTTELDLPGFVEEAAQWSITVTSPDGSLGQVVGSVWEPPVAPWITIDAPE